MPTYLKDDLRPMNCFGKTMRSSLAIATATLLGMSAFAQTPPTKAGPNAASKSSKAASAPSTAQMNAMMKSMQDMHDKMMAAKTPEERQALMNEHMKIMQEGMTMMGQMRGGQGAMGPGGGMGMGIGPEAMSKRMDMMELMMQMMMDRESTQASPAK